jgi:7-cyano-7-deazaguanine synthase
MRKCVVLLSGGLDSTTALAVAKSQGLEPHALTVLYGQRHDVEVEAARRVAAALGVAEHKFVTVGLRQLGGSALTDDIDVPKDRPHEELGSGIPSTYVPARNTIFLALALAYAETIGAYDVVIGVNTQDYSGYPDCRPEFIEAFENLANVGTKMGAEGSKFLIHTPLANLSKVEIIKKGLALGVDYAMTHSCYDPDENDRPCGRCDSCLIRAKAFAELGMKDPVTVDE